MALQYGAYIAMAGIGLYAMFVGEVISIFHFMSEQTFATFEPESKMLQFISIGVAPASDHVWYILYDWLGNLVQNKLVG